MQLPAPCAEHAIRILLIGDIVGKPGVAIVCDSIDWIRRRVGVDLIIANAENAADGAGLTVNQYKKLIEAGIDAITLGDHIYRKKEIASVLNRASNISSLPTILSKLRVKNFASFRQRRVYPLR